MLWTISVFEAMLKTTNMTDEYLDLVDKNDQVIGKKLRSEIYAENIHNFRVVNLFLKNSKGELWIPRRTAHKRLFPLALDISMGGHVESGETYEEALLRETQEELNINLGETPHRFLGKVTPPTHGVYSYSRVYEILSDKAPSYNPEDFCEYFWLTPEALLAWIAQGEKSKGDLPILVKLFYTE